ncbi:MAG: hypothetical protein J6N20_15350 [Pseudomonas sp.]|nr:hypothetical protein [Pseudomonas sp.]
MTVTTTLDRQYFDGDGSNKVFPFNFRFFTNDQIYVSLIAPDGTITLQNLTTNYTLSGALQAGGGTVTMVVAPPLTIPATRVFIQRILPQVQPTSIRNQGKFYPEIHEDAFDRLTMLIQQALAGLSNALQLTFSKTGWNFLGYRGINAADPINDQDLTTKSWVANQISGANSYAYSLYLKSISYAESLVAGVVGGYGSFIQVGAGAVVRIFQDKMRDLVSPKDFGAIGDGVADDRTSVNLSNAIGLDVQAPSGTYKLTNTITYGSATYHSGWAAKYNSSANFSFRLGSGTEIVGGSFSATGGVGFDFLPGATGSTLRDLKISNTSSANATAVNMNTGAYKDINIQNARIEAYGYGVLTNAGATVDGLIIGGSFIDSLADPIELNAPGVSHRNAVIYGSVLRAKRTSTDRGAGFAVGIAAAKNVSVWCLAIPESRFEAVHVEDQVDTISVGGVVAENCKGDFLRVATDGIEGRTGGKGFPVVGNNAKSYSAGLGNCGAYLVFNVNGSSQGMGLIANHFYGFDKGLSTGRADVITSANVLDTCGVAAISSDGGGFVYGINLALNTPTLAKSSEGTLIGPIYSTTVPTTILDTSAHVAGLIGTVLEGFAYRGKTDTLPSATTTPIDLFLLPRVMCGRLIVRVRFGNAFIYGSADVLWDGTALTVTRAIKHQAGALAWSGTTFTAVGGQLRMQLQNSGAGALNVVTDVKFNGEYYK